MTAALRLIADQGLNTRADDLPHNIAPRDLLHSASAVALAFAGSDGFRCQFTKYTK